MTRRLITVSGILGALADMGVSRVAGRPAWLIRALVTPAVGLAAWTLGQRSRARRRGELKTRSPDSSPPVDEIPRLSRESAILLRLSQELLGASSQHKILDLAAAAALELVGTDCASVFTPDPAGQLLVLRGERGLGEGAVGRLALDIQACNVADWVASWSGPVAVDDFLEENRFGVPPWVRELGQRSGLAAPMRVRGENLGVLAVACKERRRFTATEGDLLAMAANQVAVALHSVAAHERERTLRAELEAVGEASMAIATAIPAEQAMDLIVEAGRVLVGARYGILVGCDGGGDGNAMAIRAVQGYPVRPPFPFPDGLRDIARRVLEGSSLRLPDAMADRQPDTLPAGHPRVTSFLGVPLLSRGRVLGALFLANKEGAEEFSTDDQRVAEMLAAQSGIHLENARLYHQVKRLAVDLEAKVDQRTRELQSSEERLRTSVENMLDAVGIYSAIRDETGQIVDFRIEYVNAAACASNGLSREEQVGRRLLEVLPDRREPGLFEDYCRVVESGEPLGREAVVRGGGASYPDQRVYDIRVARLGDGFVAAWRDVTKRRRAEEALRDSEERWRSLVLNAPDMIISVDREGTVLSINRPPVGLSIDGVVGTNIYDYVALEHRERARQTVAGVFATGDPASLEVTTRRRGDRSSWKSARFGPVRRDGRVVAVTMIVRDVTDRKRTETRLAQVNQTFLGFGPDPTENVRRLTALVGELLGAHHVVYERLGNNARLHPVNHWNLPPDYEPVDIPGCCPCHESFGSGREGASVVRDLQRSPCVDANPNIARLGLRTYLGHPVKCRGQQIGSLCVFFQLDYESNVEDERILGIIASAVGVEEERWFAQRELARARDAAEAASKAKSEFLATMSHELRTPLNAVIGYSQLLAEESFGALNEQQASFVAHVLEGGDHLLDLISDVLDLTKVEAGRLELEPTRFEVAAALNEALTTVATLGEKKGIRLSHEISERLPTIWADRTKFKQIVYNLLSNALKFTPEGGSVKVTASLEAKADSADGQRLIRVSVADTGIGIRPEDQRRIFNAFEQVDSSYARQQQGTGLGLTLTRRLVELHGGRIWLESEGLGKGSTFTFVLPVDGKGGNG